MNTNFVSDIGRLTTIKAITMIGFSLLMIGCEVLPGNNKALDFSGDSKSHMFLVQAEDRLVYAKQFGALCAEPSPDALSATARSFAAGLEDVSGNKAEIASSFGEAISSIGVRTQSIQLMRDALYRACEAYYSRALNKALYYDLHKRYQDHMIAILAIEQLTGVVKGDQGSVVSTSQSVVANSVRDIGEINEEAKKTVETEKAALDALTAKKAEITEKIEQAAVTLAAKQEELGKHTTSIAEQEKIVEENQGDDADKKKARDDATAEIARVNTLKEAVEAEIAEASKVAPALESEQQVIDEQIKSQQKTFDTAVEMQKTIEANLEASIRQAKSVAGGAALVKTQNANSNIDILTVNSIATAVENIARLAVERTRTGDVCLQILARAAGVDDEKDQSFANLGLSKIAKENLIDTCSKILTGEDPDDSNDDEEDDDN